MRIADSRADTLTSYSHQFGGLSDSSIKTVPSSLVGPHDEPRKDFGFETTLASRTFAPWIRSLVEDGYEFRLAFLWVPNVDMAIERVRSRVRAGGHGVPEETIRRRFEAGLHNFFELYRPLAATWSTRRC